MNQDEIEKNTILIVDDKLENLDVLIAYLEKFDLRFLVARSGEEMFKRIEQVTPDIILLDVLMPGLDGFEACRRLKASEAYRDIPVIFMTALSDTVDKIKGFELGAVDYITKPFKQEEVLARVKTHLTIQHLQKDLQVKNKELQKTLERERKLVEDLRLNLSISLPHELRTPLTGIIGFSGFLTDPLNLPEPDRIAEFGDEIYKNGLRLHRLVENSLLYANLKLLNYAHKDRRRWQSKSSLDVKGFITSVARQRAKDAGRQEDLVLDLVNARIRISPKNFEKILTELLDNAFKFSRAGTSVRVTTQVDGDHCILRITDQGRGMTQEQIANIGAYMQFDRSQHEQQGLGLGLIITYLLTQLEGGELSVESVLDQGTTISIVLKCELDEKTTMTKDNTYWFDVDVSAISEWLNKQRSVERKIIGNTPLPPSRGEWRRTSR